VGHFKVCLKILRANSVLRPKHMKCNGITDEYSGCDHRQSLGLLTLNKLLAEDGVSTFAQEVSSLHMYAPY